MTVSPFVVLFFNRVFHKLFSQDLGHVYAHLPVSRNSSSTTVAAAAPVFKRTISWTRNSPVIHTGLRSGKVDLEKIRRSRSESDGAYDESVTLESVTDLENKKEQENSVALSQLQCQEVQSECLVLKFYLSLFLSLVSKERGFVNYRTLTLREKKATIECRATLDHVIYMCEDLLKKEA